MNEVESLRARVAVLEAELDNLQDKYNILLAELGQHIEVPLQFGLTRHEAGALGAIMARPIAFKSTIMAAIYADKVADDETPMEKIIDVFVCKLRKKLDPFGISVETVWGQGYKMSAENKQKILDLMRDEGLNSNGVRVAS
jgi:DNA-binding response OmpR family regulator